MSAAQRFNEWEVKVRQWKMSEKSITAWCQEHSIPEHRFYYWRKKLQAASPQVSKDSSSFVQLVDSTEETSGVELKIQQFTISLFRKFDSITLKRCLKLLQEVSC